MNQPFQPTRFAALDEAPVDIDVTDPNPGILECIEEANVDFAEDIKHHLEWLEKTKPGAGMYWAINTIAELATWAEVRGELEALTKRLTTKLQC